MMDKFQNVVTITGLGLGVVQIESILGIILIGLNIGIIIFKMIFKIKEKIKSKKYEEIINVLEDTKEDIDALKK